MDNVIVTCPKCGFHVSGPEQWGCFCDLDIYPVIPQKCVLDDGFPEDCKIAVDLFKDGRPKTDCKFWRKW